MDYNHRLANGKALEIDGKVKDVNISRTAQSPLQRAEEVEEVYACPSWTSFYYD